MAERPDLEPDAASGSAARDLAAARFALLQRLADDIEHEVRNPVQAAAISLEILRRKSASPDARSYADAVEAELNRIERLVGSTLRMLRPDPDEKGNQAVAAGIEIALPLLAAKAHVARIELEYAPATGAAPADPEAAAARAGDASREPEHATDTGPERVPEDPVRTAARPSTVALVVLEAAGALVESLRPDGSLRVEVGVDKAIPTITILGTGERETEIRVSNEALYHAVGMSVSSLAQDDRHARVTLRLPSTSA